MTVATEPHAPSRSHHVRPTRLDRYLDHCARYREIVVLPAARGSLLVVDRLAADSGDSRLVAHLSAQEPLSNALLVCHQYLSDPAGRFCRAVTPGDCRLEPESGRDSGGLPGEVAAPDGSLLGIEPVTQPRGRQVRWVVRTDGRLAVVSLRNIVGLLEDYWPARAMTVDAVRGGGRQAATLIAELRRLDASAIVLNRKLREAVVAAVADGSSLSEIASRCGRVKRDGRGVVSGETSWLARRVGLMSEGSGRPATPWVHSDTLALIARRGLGLSPREVELG